MGRTKARARGEEGGGGKQRSQGGIFGRVLNKVEGQGNQEAKARGVAEEPATAGGPSERGRRSCKACLCGRCGSSSGAGHKAGGGPESRGGGLGSCTESSCR